MKLVDFIRELENIALEIVPEVESVKTKVINDGPEFSLGTELIYSEPSCILSDPVIYNSEIFVSLGKDLEYVVSSYSLYPEYGNINFGKSFEEFLKEYKKVLGSEYSQALYKSIVKR